MTRDVRKVDKAKTSQGMRVEKIWSESGREEPEECSVPTEKQKRE